jgi:hypothetical protein
MKIILSFPRHGDQNRPEQPAEVVAIPRVGELVSLDGSSNFEVESVVHHFVTDTSHKVIVNVEECGTKRRKLEGQI